MIELLTLGTLDVRDAAEDRSIHSVLRRPKRVALLAYLAVARPPGAIRRDTLTAVFWPESTDQRARHALSQSLYVLRRGLRGDVLVDAGDDAIALNREAIRCDVWSFRRALEADRYEEALRLYRGELLAGFHLGAPGFERWLDTERRLLQQQAREAGLELSRRWEARGDRSEAIRWMRRVAAWVPHDESVHRRLVTLLARDGDRAGALREHEAFVRRFRDDLEIPLSDEFLSLAEEIRAGRVGPGAPTGDGGRPISREEGEASSERDGTIGDGSGENDAGDVESAGDAEAAATSGARRESAGNRSRSWAGALALTVAAIVAIGAIGIVEPGVISPEPEPAPGLQVEDRAPSPDRVAVLPFRVRGDEGLEYLREGVMELLSAELDGAGRIHSVGPRALLDFVAGRRTDSAGAPTSVRVLGRALAEQFGAGRLVRGSVVEAGGRASLHAELYDTRGRQIAVASAGPAEETEIFRMVETVARQLIGREYADRGRTRTSLAASTTGSLPAFKAYLDGVGAFRDARYQEAVRSLRRAVALDTTFALAWYRLAVASDWTEDPGRSPEAARRALRHADRLPPREQRLLEAWRAFTSSDIEAAERLYRTVLETYPDDVEAWFQLGEVLFHHAWRKLHPAGEVRRIFERVLQLDPEHEGALLHLARLAAADGRQAEVSELVRRFLAVKSTGQVAVEMKVLRALSDGESEGLADGLADMRRLDPSSSFPALYTLFYARDGDAASELARLLAEPDRPSGVRAAGHLFQGLAEFSRGRWRAAKRELARGRPLAPGWSPAWATEFRALFATAPFLELPERALRDLRSTVSQGASRWGSPASRPFLVAHEGIHPSLATYLSGLLLLRLGEIEAAMERADELGTLAVAAPDADDGPAGGIRGELAHGLRAAALRAAGRPEEALRALDRARTPPRYENALTSPFYQLSRERYLRALLLEETGRTEEALRLYSTFPRSVHELPYLAPSHLRRAAIHDRRGRAGLAVKHYRRVLELWKDAGPAFRPLVERARRRAATLATSRTPKKWGGDMASSSFGSDRRGSPRRW